MADETIVPHIDILIFLSRKGNRQRRAGKRFKTEYSGTKCGRFLSFVTSSPLSKDAKFFNKGICLYNWNLRKKIKKIHLSGCIEKVFSLKCRDQRFQEKRKIVMEVERIVSTRWNIAWCFSKEKEIVNKEFGEEIINVWGGYFLQVEIQNGKLCWRILCSVDSSSFDKDAKRISNKGILKI
jgi:hypothetical protein